MLAVISDTLLDVLKLLPFLFITYLAMEFLEHRSAAETSRLVRKAGALGPLVGAAAGVVPQCGFSASASNLYAQRLISAGTLIAVYLSTSDEMLPVMLSEAAPIALILKVLLTKLICALTVGFLTDRFLRRLFKTERKVRIHEMCVHEHCQCEEKGILYSAVVHTLQIAAYILIITFILNTVIHFVGEERLAHLILNKPVIGPIVAGLVGLIPNCAASVVITELFLSGAMSTGAMLAGLLAGCGVGVLVLFRSNREHPAENIKILSVLYLSGVLIGILFDLSGLSF